MTTAVNSVGNYAYDSTQDYFGLNSGTSTATSTSSLYNSSNIWGTNSAYGYNNPYLAYNNKMGAQNLAIQDQCAAIATVVGGGQEDEILEEFNELVTTLKSQDQYSQCSDQELKAVARNIFQNTTGVSLNEAINKNCSGSFMTGLKNAINPFGDDKTSKDDLISEINGTKKKKGANEAKVVGSAIGIAGAAAAGAGIGFAVGGPIGAAIGGAIGGVGSFLKSLF
ncbi:MAG: hypothetical protein PHV37_05730 [Candidatus Gastranaerophilales bacterium]|nr:hypothetical protein [Candidatus Gastranaerophilales bacterium]